jgi:hypothetical protein
MTESTSTPLATATPVTAETVPPTAGTAPRELPENWPPDAFGWKVMGGPQGNKEVVAARRCLTPKEVRAAYPNRPFSLGAETMWGGTDPCADDTALLLNDAAARCTICRAVIQNRYLLDGVCPECDGRAEYHGYNPHVADSATRHTRVCGGAPDADAE